MIAKAQQVEPHRRLWTREEFDRLKEFAFFGGEDVELVEGEIVRQSHVGPQRRFWTKEESYRLAGLGFFEGQKAELLGGEFMVASPQGWPHHSTLGAAAELLRNLWAGVWVREQGPLDLGLVTEPEPDVSVVTGRRQDYTAHPTAALLVIEVSDKTLAFDRSTKASLYAAGGIADYWVINLVQWQLEVYRQSVPDPAQPYGYRYADSAIYFRGQTITPLAAPSIVIPVSDLVP
jgi:Uma2 family endonuclease